MLDKQRLLVALLAGSLMLSSSAAFAQDDTAPAQTQTESAPASDTTLKGGVKVIELNLQLLNDFGLDLKKLLRSTNDLHDEVTIQPVSINTTPEVIGAGTIIYLPTGFQPTGAYMPPRKKRVDLAMGDIKAIVDLLKGDADDALAGHLRLDYPGDTKEELQPTIKSWVDAFEEMSTHLSKLETLTVGPNYDNASIATEVGAIHKITQDLDKSRRKVYKIVQKEGKRRKDKNA